MLNVRGIRRLLSGRASGAIEPGRRAREGRGRSVNAAAQAQGGNGELAGVIQLALREREARDRHWWGLLKDAYWEQSTVRLSWLRGTGAEFVARSREMSGKGVVTRHRLGPPVGWVIGDRALVFLPAVVEAYPTVNGVDAVLSSYARLIYRVERRDAAWKIAHLQAIYERDELVPAVPGQHITVPPDSVDGLRKSYQLLAWHLGSTGFPVEQDLPGDDQPEGVALIYQDAFDWIGYDGPLLEEADPQ
jgi:hypothetical protein